MKKALIISSSILLFLIVLAGILFGAVFRVRKQNIVIVGEDVEFVQEIKDEILASAGIKNGKSIFMLDKETAINNIEKTYPYVKVIQIKTVSVTEIQIIVRKRFDTYYVENNSKYYILDEDLKVLAINEIQPNLTKYNSSGIIINNNTKVGDFVGNNYAKQAAYDLFVALYEKANMDREAMSENVLSVSFATGYTLSESYVRMILETKQGVTIDIYKPEQDLGRKIHICYTAISAPEVETGGTIKIFLDQNGLEKIGYFAPQQDLD
ncbi:MAG: FtsQ-type POTRA domain-containing protein [Clostridia bacterium]|nr:FtsQ-type POTRA domain-containing protein [Clostridia bacterium]